MTKPKHRTIDNLVFTLYIALLPILPEYFRIGGSPVFVFLGILPFITTVAKKGKIKIHKAFWKLMLPLFILAIISYGTHGEISSLARYFMLPFLLTLIIFIYIKTEEDVYDALKTLVYVGLFMCFFGLIEKLFHFNIFSIIENVDLGRNGTQAAIRNDVVRVELSFGTPIIAGLYMIFINGLSYILMTSERTDKKRKKTYLLTYLLTFPVVYLTDSRMCLMTILLLQVLFFMRERWDKKAVVVSVLAVIFFDFAIGGFLTQFLGKYIGLVENILQNGINTSDLNTEYRLQLIPVLMPMIREKFLFGYGSEFLNGYKFRIMGGYAGSIDNMFLETMMRHGLLGFAISMIPIITSLVLSKQICSFDDKTGYLFLAIFVIYLVNLISVAQLGEQKVFYTIFAILFSFVYKLKKINGKVQ